MPLFSAPLPSLSFPYFTHCVWLILPSSFDDAVFTLLFVCGLSHSSVVLHASSPISFPLIPHMIITHLLFLSYVQSHSSYFQDNSAYPHTCFLTISNTRKRRHLPEHKKVIPSPGPTLRKVYGSLQPHLTTHRGTIIFLYVLVFLCLLLISHRLHFPFVYFHSFITNFFLPPISCLSLPLHKFYS